MHHQTTKKGKKKTKANMHATYNLTPSRANPQNRELYLFYYDILRDDTLSRKMSYYYTDTNKLYDAKIKVHLLASRQGLCLYTNKSRVLGYIYFSSLSGTRRWWCSRRPRSASARSS